MKTTNYYNTFIEVADGRPAEAGEALPRGEALSAAAIQYEMIAAAPYTFTLQSMLYHF